MMERSEFINGVGEIEPITYVHAFVVEQTDGATLLPYIQQFVKKWSEIKVGLVAA